jgi:hypothetical protein
MPTDILQDLHDARTLIEQSGSEDEKRKYRKAAEIILLKALNQEPENREAKALLQSARAVPALSASFTPLAPEVTREPVPFLAEAAIFKNIEPPKKKKSALKLPMGLSAVVLVGGGLLWTLQSHPGNLATLAAPVARSERRNPSDFHPAVGDAHESVSSSTVAEALPPAGVDPPVNAIATPVAPINANPTPVTNVAASAKTTTPPAVVEIPRPTPPAMGSLAVSSPTVAEIYQNGQFIGSTPTTLQLPSGQQSLEYRHGDLRTVVVHDIKPNETTAASVTFQVTVQINAKPWAQVFLDGAQRRPLGQTPLSGVSVPIGGTLVFENPNFAPKTYRITEKDAAIQLNFP